MSKTITPTPGKKATAKVALATASTLPALNKNLAITNNSSVDITMLDGFGTDDSQVAYGQSLTRWTTTEGSTSIKAGATGTIVLDDTHDYNGTPTYTKVYSIIYAKPDNLFPVKIKGSMLVSKTQSYTPVTITGDDATVMTQTQEFVQTIMANPTSPLAQNYATAMKAANDSATSDTGMDDQVSTFFANTDDFKSVTMDSVIAVQSYYDNFPYVWANYQNTKSFYFYSTDGTTVAYEGSIALTIPAAPTTDKSLPGFSFAFTDANNNTTALKYINGLFLDDKDVPKISLSGLFVKKSMLTKDQADDVIVPILTGTIHDIKVLGYEDKPKDVNKPDDPNDRWSGMYNMLHPTNFAGVLSLFLTFVGVAMGIKYLRESGGEIKAELLKAKEWVADKLGLNSPEDAPLAPDDVTAAKTNVEKSMSPQEEWMQQMMDQMQVQMKMNQDLLQSMKDGQAQLEQQNNQDERADLDDEGAQLENELQGELDAGINNTKLVNDDEQVDDLLGDIDGATADQLGAVLEADKGKFADVKVDVDANFAKAMSQADADAKEELSEAQQGIKDAEAEEEAIEQQKQDTEDGKNTDENTKFEGEEDIT